MKHLFEKGYTPWNKKPVQSKLCQFCGNVFERSTTVNWPQFLKQKYCSYRCASDFKKENRKPIVQPTRTCPQCNKVFKRPYGYSKKQWSTRLFCSNACLGQSRDQGYEKRAHPLRHCARYTNWRKAVMLRDNFTCQFCGQAGGSLNADHIKPFSLLLKLNDIEGIYDLNNGRTLCVECHKSTPTYGVKGVGYANSICA